VGYWSRDCEGWLQKHFKNIEGMKLEMRTTGKWRTSMKFTQQCSQMAQKNDRFAALFLKNIFAHPAYSLQVQVVE
jgi:hypothetical protein